jgi:hypothetical protein
MRKTIGWDTLKSEFNHSFKKWGEYMKRAQTAERKVKKLKALLLLTDPSVSDIVVNDIAIKQWNEFIREFPDEGDLSAK